MYNSKGICWCGPLSTLVSIFSSRCVLYLNDNGDFYDDSDDNNNENDEMDDENNDDDNYVTYIYWKAPISVHLLMLSSALI